MTWSRQPRPAHERFWEKVDRRGDDECWNWTASCHPPRYGQFGIRHGVIVRAHRFAYELLVGPIPEGLHLDHLCRNPSCVNPAHLEPVTPGENVRRGEPATKTCCVNGHEYTEANTYRSPKTGRRQCRICRRDAVRRYKASMSEAAA